MRPAASHAKSIMSNDRYPRNFCVISVPIAMAAPDAVIAESLQTALLNDFSPSLLNAAKEMMGKGRNMRKCPALSAGIPNKSNLSDGMFSGLIKHIMPKAIMYRQNRVIYMCRLLVFIAFILRKVTINQNIVAIFVPIYLTNLMAENHNKTLSPELKEKLSKIRHLALDMDGTIYMGSTLFPFTKKFLSDMKESGISYSFLTNNPSKSVADYLKKLEGLGIDANEDNMYTTSLAAIDYIKSHFPEAKRLFLLGTPSMITQFEKAGYISCADDPDDVPDVLVVAFDMSLEYSRLCRASWWASQGIPYVATNPDRVCPTDQRTVLVDCGSMCKCIEHATGRQPDVCVGKPDPNMLRGVFERYGYKPEEVAMVGDRIYTDTATAHNAGAFGVLVLSGETTLEVAEKVAEDARTNPAPEFFPPDLIVRDVKELGELLLANR